MKNQAPRAGDKPLKFYLAAAVLMTLVGIVPVVLLEVGLRLFWPQELRVVGGTNIGYKIPDKEILEGVLKPNAHMIVEGPEFRAEYRINPQGLRDEVTHAAAKPSGRYRILLVGDSFTFGFGSNYEEIWPVVFEQALARRGYAVDVVKAGAPMYDTRSEALLLKRLLPVYQPDLVLLTFLPNDLFTNTPVERAPSAEDIQAVSTANPFEFQVITFAKRALMASDWMNLRLYLLKRRQYFEEPHNTHVRQQYEVTRNVLGGIHRYLKDHNVEFAVQSLPQQFQVIQKARGYTVSRVDPDSVDRIMGPFATKQGIQWLSPLAMMVGDYQTRGEDQYFRADGHLTRHGNRLVGDWLAGEVVRRWESRLPRI